MVRPQLFAWALLLGACFTGGFSAGLPCAGDLDCGPDLRCEAGFCGGPSGQATGSSSAPPTTGGSSGPTTASTSSTGPDPTSGTTAEPCGIGRCKDFDVLFVADNSPSMFVKQLLLLDFIQTFGTELLPEFRKACSVHVGVVTTDNYAFNPEGCRERGALVQADTNGEPCVFVEGKPYATTPDLTQPLTLECMFSIGTEGDPNEKPVESLLVATGPFEPDLVQTCNAGFYRPEAFLVGLILTDEDDDNNDAQMHSGSDLILDQAWEAALANLKGSGYDDLYLVGVLGHPAEGEPACFWDPLMGEDGLGFEQTPELRAFLQSIPPEHHAIDTLCDRVPNAGAFVPLMDEIRAEIRAACGA